MKSLVALAICFFGNVALLAQEKSNIPKFGYVDTEYVFSQLPEAKRMESELKSLEKQLLTRIEAKRRELEEKYAAYIASEKTMVETVKASTQRELKLLDDNLRQLQQDAQAALQKKQEDLMKPILDKIREAIKAVAAENQYTFILTAKLGEMDVVLFAAEHSNVSKDVLLKLGVGTTKSIEAN